MHEATAASCHVKPQKTTKKKYIETTASLAAAAEEISMDDAAAPVLSFHIKRRSENSTAQKMVSLNSSLAFLTPGQ